MMPWVLLIVNDHDLLSSLFFRKLVKYQIDCITEYGTVSACLLSGPNVVIGNLVTYLIRLK